MLYRRKVVLAMVSKSKEPLSLIKLHTLMFLFVEASKKDFYSFIPNNFGCYSIALHDDQVALIKKQLLFEEKGDSPFRSYLSIDAANCDVTTMTLKEDDSNILDTVLRMHQMKTEHDLIDLTYRMEPYYGIRSRIIKRFADDTAFLLRVDHIKTKISHASRGLYTIGYEGFSIDSFIQQLISNNIKTLVDVRKIAFSMRREFCKTSLQEALREAGIKYIRMAEVGIPSKNRKELLPLGKKDELFAWYQDTILPQCASQASSIADLVSKENISLMCYEKDPKDCHRSLFAEYCKEKQPSIPAILHIKGASSAKEHLENHISSPMSYPSKELKSSFDFGT